MARFIISTLTAGFFAASFVAATPSYAQSWDSSPMNWNNSPMNWKNSPMNWNNSPMNSQSNRGIYDNNGNRLGYGVYTPNGGMNFFDNQGNRLGYRPGR